MATVTETVTTNDETIRRLYENQQQGNKGRTASKGNGEPNYHSRTETEDSPDEAKRSETRKKTNKAGCILM